MLTGVAACMCVCVCVSWCVYRGSASAEYQAWFWRILSECDNDQLSHLIHFAWSRARLPAHNNWLMRVAVSPTADGLPGAGTCYFQLRLPKYTSFEDLHKALHSYVL